MTSPLGGIAWTYENPAFDTNRHSWKQSVSSPQLAEMTLGKRHGFQNKIQ